MTTARKMTVALAITALALTFATAADPTPAAKAELGKAAPDFELKDTYGKPFKLTDFKGKIVVLEWLNRQCPVSRGCHEKAVMQTTYKKYAAKGIIWLAIDTTAGTDPEANRIYAAAQGLAYPILHDTDGKVGHAYAAATTPHMFVIDKQGILLYDGAIDDRGDKNHVSAALEDLLAGRKVAKPKTKPYGCGVKYPPPPNDRPDAEPPASRPIKRDNAGPPRQGHSKYTSDLRLIFDPPYPRRYSSP